MSSIYVTSIDSSDEYAFVKNLKGDSFKITKGLVGLQQCGWFLKYKKTETSITEAIMLSTKKCEKCILCNKEKYSCDICCYETKEVKK